MTSTKAFPNAEDFLHAKRVARIVEVLASHMGFPISEIEDLGNASLYHDVGKSFIPKEILYKQGALTPAEFAIIQGHTTLGAQYLAEQLHNCQHTAVTIAQAHHERWDGNGYPLHEVGDEIPLAAQIVGLADCFDALCRKRCYKDAYSPSVAYTMIIQGECGVFSPRLLQSFTQLYQAHKLDALLQEGETASTPST